MRSTASSVLAVPVLLALALVAQSSVVRADNGYQTDYSNCFAINTQFFSLPAVCVNFHLDTCDRYLRVNMTYNGLTPINFEITDIAHWMRCFTPSGVSACETCLRFVDSTTVLTPSYANLCPEVVTTCTVFGEPVVLNRAALGCLTLGVNCAEQPSCSACMAASSTCGWCGNFTSGQCLIKGVNGGVEPYCATCAVRDTTVWAQDMEHCPADPAQREDSESWAARNKGVIIGVSVSGFVLIGGVAALCFARRRMTSRDNREPPRGAMPLADQGDSSDAQFPIAVASGAAASPTAAAATRSEASATSASAAPVVRDEPPVRDAGGIN